MLSSEKQVDPTEGNESKDENEQAFFKVCGTSGFGLPGKRRKSRMKSIE